MVGDGKGPGSAGAVPAGAWDGVARAGAVGWLGRVPVGRGGCGAVRARRVFDRGAGSPKAGAGEARARRQGVGDDVGCLEAVGAASGGRGSADNERRSRCTEGVRQIAGRQFTGDCGQHRGPKLMRSTWGGSGGQGPAPGHVGLLFAAGWASGHGGGACPCHGWLGLGFLVRGVSGVVQQV